MKKSVFMFVCFLSLMFAGSSMAAPSVLIDKQDNWQYSNLGFDANSNWGSIGFGSVDWSNLTWSNGKAAFGNPYQLSYSTEWMANTDLALQKTVHIDGNASNILLNVAADNGFIVFVNGTEVARGMAEGYTSYWEYSQGVNSSLFVKGDNIINVIAEDHGGATFFDMNLTAEVTPTPIPGAAVLLFSGLAGLLGLKRKSRA